ncbi:hypothetical protein M9458_025128, partial [Cirrhinus mrigala]
MHSRAAGPLSRFLMSTSTSPTVRMSGSSAPMRAVGSRRTIRAAATGDSCVPWAAGRCSSVKIRPNITATENCTSAMAIAANLRRKMQRMQSRMAQIRRQINLMCESLEKGRDPAFGQMLMLPTHQQRQFK